MDNDYSYEAMLEFLDYASDMGLLKSNTAGGRKSAAQKVHRDLLEQEAADVRTVDLDLLFQRFVNRNKVQVAPKTLRTYKRRLESTIEEFLAWRADPTNYRPAVAKRTSRKPQATKPAAAVKEAESEAPPSPPEPAPGVAPHQGALTLPFPLRPDFLATIQVPRDLKASEAERLGAFIRTLAMEESD